MSKISMLELHAIWECKVLSLGCACPGFGTTLCTQLFLMFEGPTELRFLYLIAFWKSLDV